MRDEIELLRGKLLELPASVDLQEDVTTVMAGEWRLCIDHNEQCLGYFFEWKNWFKIKRAINGDGVDAAHEQVAKEIMGDVNRIVEAILRDQIFYGRSLFGYYLAFPSVSRLSYFDVYHWKGSIPATVERPVAQWAQSKVWRN